MESLLKEAQGSPAVMESMAMAWLTETGTKRESHFPDKGCSIIQHSCMHLLGLNINLPSCGFKYLSFYFQIKELVKANVTLIAYLFTWKT